MDREQHGIVRDLDVGQNITLSVLGQFARATRIDGDAELTAVRGEIARKDASQENIMALATGQATSTTKEPA